MSFANSDKRRSIFSVFSLVLALVMVSCMLAFPVHSDAASMTREVQGFYPAQSSFYDAKPTASDIDADGQQELIVGNTNGYLYCFDAYAQVKWAYCVGASIRGSAACKDVDGDGKQEVFIGDMNGVVWGFNCYGGVLSQWGWPKQTPATGGYIGVYSSPAIGDINGDGAEDIVVGTYGHHVFAWSFSGGQLPGWPYDNQDTIWSSPALADIDRDGLKEVIIGADSTGGVNWPYPPGGLLYAFNGDGSMVPGWPKITPEVTWSSPAVADIDGDGFCEIIVGTGHYYKAIGTLSTQGHYVYAYNHDGSMVPGFPVTVGGSTFSSPAIGDMNGDGALEIVIGANGMRGIGDDQIVAIRPDGQFAWVGGSLGGPNMGSPALGDTNGDGKAEAILGSGIELGAWDSWGNLVWRQALDNYIITSPVVGDFDSDGRVEVAVGTGDATGGSRPGGSFYIFDCGANKYLNGGNKSSFPWTMFRYNSEHHASVLIGNEPAPPPPPPPPANFHEYILLMNPGSKTATAQIELMNEQGEVVTVSKEVAPSSRSTFMVNQAMAGCGVSAKVTSDQPIICERAMYFNFQGRWQGGTDSAGAQEPADTWYLAEGYTADNFDEYVLVQNPGSSAVNVTMTFMVEGGSPQTAGFNIAPQSRFTLNVKDIPGLQNACVSTKVEASGDVICERSMYFNYNGNVGGHNAMGVSEPAGQWYLAEGYTAQSYDTFVLIQNPGNSQAKVELNFLRSDGHQYKQKLTLPAMSRKTIKVDDVPGFEAAEVSTEVTSDKPVIAERAMYFNSNGRDGGHDSTGVSEPAQSWYLAEGYTGGSFDTYILVMNPQNEKISVKATFMRSDGHVHSENRELLPRSRYTIHVDGIPGFENAEVSTLIEGLGGPVIAERAMYFIYNDAYPGGHDSTGVKNASTTWYFAEGYTGL
ncbi:MAG: VCBS repeat-containing protein [Actinobacteria bacterium]|nr:VCBS repeat-containing protein [Actinomycetota bacterium]